LFSAVFVAGTAAAQVDLRFDPPDTTIAVGDTLRMGIMIDQVIDVRTIDVNVLYDTNIVKSLGGGEGSLYTDSGIFTFAGFEEDTLGHWHGYAVLMGAGLFIEGPGELFYWEFEGLAEGVTPIIAAEVYLSMTDGSWYSDVILPYATVRVGEISHSPDVPPVKTGLNLWPNPFNPRVSLGFDLAAEDWVRIEVYDVQGRRVAALYDGIAPAGPFTATWDGRDQQGHAAPGGVYLFRLVTPRRTAFTRGVLLK
jgi:hypothetical protein